MSEHAGDDEREQETGAISPDEQTVESYFSADRAKAFIDAVVAIALTLLIFPLLDAITRLASESTIPSAATWIGENWFLLLAFLISFALIGNFWINHHRMFARVRRVTTPLLWLNIAWLLTIVLIPVVTAMMSIMSSDDPIAKVCYIGMMALTSLLTFTQQLFLRAHPALHDIRSSALLGGMVASLSTAVLFMLSLLVSILVPQVGYLALFLLMLTSPVVIAVERILGVRPSPERALRRKSGA